MLSNKLVEPCDMSVMLKHVEPCDMSVMLKQMVKCTSLLTYLSSPTLTPTLPKFKTLKIIVVFDNPVHLTHPVRYDRD